MVRKELSLLFHITVVFIFVATTALGQGSSFLHGWQLDDDGPAYLIYGVLAGFVHGTNEVDPESGTLGWYYNLQTPHVTGDILLVDAQGSSNVDLLRFDTNGVFFFSSRLPSADNPDNAYVPVVPTPIDPVVLSVVESVGTNGTLYVPGPGMPGFDTSGQLPGLRYNLISDVPEPSTIALTGIGVVGLLVVRRRRKQPQGH